MHALVRAFTSSATALLIVSTAMASTLYWSNIEADGTGAIRRANLETFAVELVVPSGFTHPYRLAIDASGGKLYWTSPYDDWIQRANLDGSDVETIACVDGFGIGVDGAAGKVYWSRGNDVWRMDLDGANPEFLFDAGPPGLIQDLTLDLTNGHVYVSNWDGWTGTFGKLQRANLDGTGLVEVPVEIRNGPVGLGVDSGSEKIYIARFNASPDRDGQVMRANLDGSEPETIVADVDADSLALDSSAGKVYWTEMDEDYTAGTIQRANLDGSDYEVLPLAGLVPVGIAILPDDEIPCPGDLDGDLDIDLADLATLLPNYGMTSGATYSDGDIDGDGDVDLSDLAALLGVYGTTCE